jgi:hypothetical protein
MQWRGRRELFNLNTSNKAAAASKAKDIYATLVGAGWDVALEKFKPEMKRQAVLTVGEFLNELREHWSGKPKTFEDYCRSFRTILSDFRHQWRPGEIRLRQRRTRCVDCEDRPYQAGGRDASSSTSSWDALVGGEGTDQFEDNRDIGALRWADFETLHFLVHCSFDLLTVDAIRVPDSLIRQSNARPPAEAP